MKTLKDMPTEEMRDPDFRTAFEAAGRELARVAERMRTARSAVARMESGREEPSPSRLRAHARAIGAELHIEFRPQTGDGMRWNRP